MNKIFLFYFILFFYGCSSTKSSVFGIDSVQLAIPSDPSANYIELIGYFQINQSNESKELECILSSENEINSFNGILLPGGNIFSIKLSNQLKEFLVKNHHIFVKIDSFYGEIEQESIPNKNVILQYLQNTIIYDL